MALDIHIYIYTYTICIYIYINHINHIRLPLYTTKYAYYTKYIKILWYNMHVHMHTYCTEGPPHSNLLDFLRVTILPGTNVQGTGLLSGGHLIPKLLGNLQRCQDPSKSRVQKILPKLKILVGYYSAENILLISIVKHTKFK